MGKYGDVAVMAAELLRKGGTEGNRPDAWRCAAKELLRHSPSSETKGCPRGAFLGLCEEGLVEGVQRGSWTNSVDNKAYALRAVQKLRADSAWLAPKGKLWRLVCGSDTKAENGQLDVVFGLWRKRLLTEEPIPVKWEASP
jgi:hypothetical protein